ncbi:MAG TPA: heme-binding protein [Terracidiphilus sp.]|nr:heme-binding protein [Terracidiphilus sp.]
MPTQAPINILQPFQQQLVGNWQNADFEGETVGGPENPLSYNIMPLPEKADPNGYILKNFRYHEKLHFNDDNASNTLAIAAQAPNRGGQIDQVATAIFYEQQVQFAEGPATGNVVHVENGTWLWLPRYIQQPGPYPNPFPGALVSAALQQPADILIAKQIAVPHGNSILALGSIDKTHKFDGIGESDDSYLLPGAPVIPDGGSPFPMLALPVPVTDGTPPPAVLISNLNADERYSTARGNPNDFQNPNPDFTLNPNLPLQQAVHCIKPDHYMHWHVTTQQLSNGKGIVTNVPFERRVSEVTDYIADYWMLFKGTKKYLAYTQTILMRLTINKAHYIFPHLTCNTVTYCD